MDEALVEGADRDKGATDQVENVSNCLFLLFVALIARVRASRNVSTKRGGLRCVSRTRFPNH